MTIITCNSGRHKMRVPKEFVVNQQLQFTERADYIYLDDQNIPTSTERTGHMAAKNAKLLASVETPIISVASESSVTHYTKITRNLSAADQIVLSVSCSICEDE